MKCRSEDRCVKISLCFCGGVENKIINDGKMNPGVHFSLNFTVIDDT